MSTIAKEVGLMVTLLGIESSCDETSVAVYQSSSNQLNQLIYSQVSLHNQYGGVVPELASRSHLEIIATLTDQLLSKYSIKPCRIDAVAYTKGPGLIGPLLVGGSFARAYAQALEKPAIPIHHLEAHICVVLYEYPEIDFPFITLLVSGGHTMLVEACALGEYRILGQTLDDACGEAFDKAGKVMGLGYPAGSQISKLAQLGGPNKLIQLPIPLKHDKSLNYSFSGLKTSFMRSYTRHKEIVPLNDFCYAIEQSIVAHLISRVKRLITQYDMPLIVAGGVAANLCLRRKLMALANQQSFRVVFPSIEYCTDNAAMVAFTAYLKLKARVALDHECNSKSYWPLDQLSCNSCS
ncbi:MAG: tRNA (adenosine(37)-N6)-threonylcarbamoyltransferase complex transferase subunit TsaD [Pseudomonadota bacterium]|nr:tRNA (adenosine(37)-N6)-threonylcarbamoyltransferase complex transferase subunit TsaD [Pseudomonadota bacterium]